MPVTVVAYDSADDLTSQTHPYVDWMMQGNIILDNLPGNHGKITITVDSVEDLVNKFVSKMSNNSWTCDQLIISGHGSPANQSVGDGETTSPGGKKSLALDMESNMMTQTTLIGSSEKTLAKIAPFLTRDAVILLGGCNVARGSPARRLLVLLSKALGNRAVEASDFLQTAWIPGNEGNIWRAKGEQVALQRKAWYNPSGTE